MKKIILCTFCLLCLGSMPLWAPQGEENTQESSNLVAAAAKPITSQAKHKPKAAPRKVPSRPEPFILNTESLEILQSTAPGHAEAKEALLEHATRAVELEIVGRLTLPNDTTKLMAPFANVRSLSIQRVSLDDLPLLPCTEKLESLR